MTAAELCGTYSIEALLYAAKCIESRDRDEHGYAALPANQLDCSSKKESPVTKQPTKRANGSRCTHNELEKNRRAHLRSCLERLKKLTPMGDDSVRHTTLGLLTKARTFIKILEDQDKRTAARREHLMREQRLLRLRIEEVTKDSYRTRRTESECSVATTSTSGHSSMSELASSDTSNDSNESGEEIDILGDSDSEDSGLQANRLMVPTGPALTDHGYGLLSHSV